MTDEELKNNKLRVNFEIGLGQLLQAVAFVVAIFGSCATAIWWFSGFVTAVGIKLDANTSAINAVNEQVQKVQTGLAMTSGEITQLNAEVSGLHRTVNSAGSVMRTLKPIPLPLPVTNVPAPVAMPQPKR